jgi:alcohol dehydrogenase
MIPAYYEFQNTVKVCSGDRALENIPYELEERNVSRPMILSDRVLEEIGTVDTVLKAMAGLRPGFVFCDIPSDSSFDVVMQIAGLYRQHRCDAVVAIGGGSVIDTAKGVCMAVGTNAEDLTAIMGMERLRAWDHIPYIAVPTTSGTGSEVTEVAVISDTDHNVKAEFISRYLLPDVAVLDARMLTSMPRRITASTGMDALCHAIEAYSCLQKNPLSDAYAISAVKMIGEYLPTAVKNGNNKKARLAMANASLMAGTAFSNSMVGGVHAIGHALGGICHLAHGDAMNILMPYVMAYNLEVCSDAYAELLLHFRGPEVYIATAPEQRGKEMVRSVRRMSAWLNRVCQLPMTLSETGKVSREQLQKVAEAAVNDGAMIVNPKAMSVEDVLFILNQAYGV